MKLHLITVGKPKLAYASVGWAEYTGRLKRYHTLRVTHLDDRKNSPEALLQAAGSAYKVGLVIKGKELSSPELATFIEQRGLEGREVAFLIGGPEGLQVDVQRVMDFQWSFGPLTFPHDLAMVVMAEALYRASTINAGLPYHK